MRRPVVTTARLLRQASNPTYDPMSASTRLPLAPLALALAAPAVAQFGPRVPAANLLQSGGAYDIAATDVNGDGLLDLATTTGTRILLFVNQGLQGFANAQVLSSGHQWTRFIEAVDLDADGDEDLVFTSRSTHQVLWLESLGNGVFSPAQLVGDLAGAWGLAVHDMDGDGDLDVVAGSFDGHLVVWFERTGATDFADAETLATGVDQPSEVVAADLDGNGTQDVVVAARAGGEIVWIPNLGGGSFAAKRTVSTAVVTPWAIATADVDADGDVDVLSASEGDGKVAWYENTGGGHFAVQTLIDNGATGALDVDVADIDRDGLVDCVVAAQGGARIRWYRNLGQGFFGAPMLMPESSFAPPRAIAVDMDGDFDLDIVNGEGFWNPNETLLGTETCVGVVNSTGVPARTLVSGDEVAAMNAIALTAADLPSFSFGYFLTSAQSGMVAQPGGSEGVLCLGGAIGRYVGPGQIQSSGPLDTVRLRLDLDRTPHPQLGLISVSAGETRLFQRWYRDTDAGGQPTSNFTSAVSVTFR